MRIQESRAIALLLVCAMFLTSFGFVGVPSVEAADMDPQAALNAKQHPYLIVSQDQYATMRSNSNVPGSVWESMKKDAINDMDEIIYSFPVPGTMDDAPGLPETETGVKLASAARLQGAIVSAATLGYILDPDNKQLYLDKTERMIEHYDQYVTPRLNSEDTWYMVVQPASGLFNMIIALDVMYDDFAAQGKLAALESKIQTAMNYFHQERIPGLGWSEAVHSVRGAWGLYKKDWAAAKQGIDDYMQVLNERVNEDGVFNGGARYADERFNSPVFTRDSKSYFIDVIEFQDLYAMTGDESYAPQNLFYENEKFQMLYEWIYGYSFSPVMRMGYGDDYRRKEYVIFGDTGFYGRDASYIHEDLSNNFFAATASLWRMPRFSDEAFRYAGLAHGNPEQPMGRLWHYLFYEESFPDPAPVPSRIFPSGNAIFYEQWDDYESSNQILGGYLWSVERKVGHSRFDTNAIHLTAYGENVLMGVGYPGYTEMMANPTYFLSSVSHNTVMIDNQKHALEYGAGLVKHTDGRLEALTNDDFGYASASTGGADAVSKALPNGEHVRNFIQVNGKDGANGYWVLFDEVEAANAGASANVLLHPSTTNAIVPVAEKQEYRSDINVVLTTVDREHTDDATIDLSVFYGTEPDSVEYKDGEFNSYGTTYPTKYLQSNYATDGDGKKRVVTVLFPHDTAHAKAEMTRLSGAGYTGASIAQGGEVVDYALESDGSETVIHEEVSFHGLAALYRKLGVGDTGHYFVRQGRSFDDGAAVRTGFQADENLTLYMDGAEGNLIAPVTTDVTFYYDDIRNVLLDDSPATVKELGADWVTVEVPAGNYEVAFETLKNVGTGPLTATIAAKASINPQTKAVVVSGTISSGAGKEIQVKVVNASGGIEYIDQASSDAEGKFRFSYTLDKAVGAQYTAYVSGTNVSSPASVRLALDTPGADPEPEPDSDPDSDSDRNPNSPSNPSSSDRPVLTVEADFDPSTGAAKSEITAEAIEVALSEATMGVGGVKTVEVRIPAVEGATKYEAVLPASVVAANRKSSVIELKTELGALTIPSHMLGNATAGESISISISKADVSQLDEVTRTAIGDRPVVELELAMDGQPIAWNNPKAPVLVSVPYEPTELERGKPEHIVVWYVDGAGIATPVPSGKYDADTGMVTFRTTHFSQYAVSFVDKSFADLSAVPWAKREIETLASKGIINGTTPETYSPSANITRADFVLLLMKALSLVSEEDGERFVDVQASDYYADAVSTARALGIVEGGEDLAFRPHAFITRQEMMTVAARAMTAAGVLDSAPAEDAVSEFSDGGQIAPFAVDHINRLVQDGIVKGSGGSLSPLAHTTRAEAAVMMYRIYNAE